MLGGGVVHDQVCDHAYCRAVRRIDERLDVLDRAVVRVHRVEIGDVVAAVAQRRGVERQQPDAVDAEPLQVVELLREPAEVARAVAVAVEEAADVDLIEDRPFEPQRVGLEPLARLRETRGRTGGSLRLRWRRYGLQLTPALAGALARTRTALALARARGGHQITIRLSRCVQDERRPVTDARSCRPIATRSDRR